jgi:hypothetical protein
MSDHFDLQWQAAVSEEDRIMWAQAGLANLLFWLGWLRGS